MKPNFFLTVVVLCSVVAVVEIASAQPSNESLDEAAELEAQAAAGGKKHRKVQKAPVKLGTTGGNVNFFPDDGLKPRCVSNTLGGLVEKGGSQYILSSGYMTSRENQAKKGEDVIQPGLNYTKGKKCNADHKSNNVVADLTKFNKLNFKPTKFNKYDAALAEARPGMVDPNGEVIGIGIPGGRTVRPFVGQRVKKSGAGTGAKVGTVVAVNFSAVVAYGRPFGAPPLANFNKQFIVQSNNNKPLVGGADSGSLFFENRTSCPGWVGLLFGLSEDGMFGLATPMNALLKKLKKLKPDKGTFEPVGCSTATTAVQEPQSRQMQQAMLNAELIQSQVERQFMQLPGVVGMGLGIAEESPEEVVIKVFLEDDTEAIRANIPERLGKVRTEIVVTGRFSAVF